MIQAYNAREFKPKMTKEELKAHIIKQRADDATPVTGIFENKETPGGYAEFSYKKWPGEEYLKFTLVDGERYTLPKGVVKHIKKQCAYPDFEHLSTQSGLTGIRGGTGAQDGRTPIKENWRVRRMIHRFDFALTSYVPGFFEELDADRILTVDVMPEPTKIITKG